MFGRIAVVAGMSPQHRAAAGGSVGLRRGGSAARAAGRVAFMNAAGEPWRRAKHAVRDPGRHRGVGDMRVAVGECFRAARHRLDACAHMERQAADCVWARAGEAPRRGPPGFGPAGGDRAAAQGAHAAPLRPAGHQSDRTSRHEAGW